jgi:hypothetical protein
MPGLPLPDRGQPIDITYMYQIVNEINNISNQISDATTDYTTIYTRSNGPQKIQTKAARIIAGYVDIVTNETVTAGTTKLFTFQYASDFLYPPVAMATVVNTGLSDIGDDVVAIIRTVTTSTVTGIVKFNKSGNVSTTVNIMVIGIPTPS